DMNGLHAARVRRHPASSRIERVQPASAEDAAARADEGAAPEVARADHRIRADVHVLVDAGGALGEPGAEPDEEALAAGFEGQPIERAAQDDARQSGDERAELRAEDEEGGAAAPLLEGAENREGRDHREDARVDGALDGAPHGHTASPCSTGTAAAAPRCFLK